MFPVLMLFLIPVGGGIPAGVLLAQKKGLLWPVTAGLYFITDVMLALAFEPVLRLIVAAGRRRPHLAHAIEVVRVMMARMAGYFGGAGAGLFTLIMIAFGVDPMTGRAAAMAAGHGFIAGWAIAIAGDMLYYAVVAFTTLRLDPFFSSSWVTMFIVLFLMVAVHILMRLSKLAYSRM